MSLQRSTAWVDAGPLIALAKLGHLGWLRQLFSEVCTTPEVWAEVTGGAADKAFADAAVLQQAQQQGLIAVPSTADTDPTPTLPAAVDAGERSLIWAALSSQATGAQVVLVADDFAARSAAQAVGLRVAGSLGLLLKAKQRGWLTQVTPALAKLRAEGYFVSAELEREVLRLAGEAADVKSLQ